jgi:hypothetical protein
MTADEKKNELIAALGHSGYTQCTKVLFEKGAVRVKLIDDRGIRISIHLANDMGLDVFSEWGNVGIDKISAL